MGFEISENAWKSFTIGKPPVFDVMVSDPSKRDRREEKILSSIAQQSFSQTK